MATPPKKARGSSQGKQPVVIDGVLSWDALLAKAETAGVSVESIKQDILNLAEQLELSPTDIIRKPRIVEPDHPSLKEMKTLAGVGVESDLVCPICMSVFQTVAVVKSCMHRFCEECIERWLRIGNQVCPQCRRKIPSRRSLRRDPLFQEIIKRVFAQSNSSNQSNLTLTATPPVRDYNAQLLMRQ